MTSETWTRKIQKRKRNVDPIGLPTISKTKLYYGGTMLNIVSKLYNFFNDEEGQGLAEYALILVLVSIAAVGALTALGGNITGVFNNVSSNLTGS